MLRDTLQRVRNNAFRFRLIFVTHVVSHSYPRTRPYAINNRRLSRPMSFDVKVVSGLSDRHTFRQHARQPSSATCLADRA